jgi:hypothetical protein
VTTKRFGRSSALVGSILCAAIAMPAAATILPFDHTDGGNTGGSFHGLRTTPPGQFLLNPTHPTYGDRVDSTLETDGIYGFSYLEGSGWTPNVVLDFTDNEPQYGWVFHNTAANWDDPVGYPAYHEASTFWLMFTPDPGYGVTLESFETDLYANGAAGGVTLNWTVRQGSPVGPVLDSGTQTGIFVGSEPTITPNVTYDGTIVLEIRFSNTNDGGILGIDNLSFAQHLIPEPGSLSLLGAGAALMLRRRRS